MEDLVSIIYQGHMYAFILRPGVIVTVCPALLLSLCAFLSSAVVCEDQSVLHGI